MSKKWVFLSQFIPYNFIFAITGYVWKVKQFDISIDIRMYSTKFKCNVIMTSKFMLLTSFSLCHIKQQ